MKMNYHIKPPRETSNGKSSIQLLLQRRIMHWSLLYQGEKGLSVVHQALLDAVNFSIL